MLTGLKVPYLAYNYVFYRPEHNARGTQEIWVLIKPWNTKRFIPMYRNHICLVIMFTPRVLVSQKWFIFCIFCWMTLTLEVNMIARQMAPFFSSTIWAVAFGIVHVCISRTSKFSSLGSSYCILFSSVKYTFICQRWQF